MLEKQDLIQVSDLIESFKPKLGFFEEKVLIPAAKERISYVVEIFEEFKKICRDPGVALHIDGALREIVNPTKIDLGAADPKVGAQYLAAVLRQCDEEYINPANQILARFNDENDPKTIESATELLMAVTNYFESILGVKETVFHYSLRSFLSVRKTDTGQTILGPPQAITLVLMPFQTRTEEMANVARTTIESIRRWAEQVADQKKKHIDIIVNLTQIKSSEQQARAAKYNMWFQVAVVIFTIVLVIAAEKTNSYLEKRDLEKALNASEIERNSYKQKLESTMQLKLSPNKK